MAANFIWLNGKKYKINRDGYSVKRSRLRTVSIGLTGSTLIQDFTNDAKKPQTTTLVLRAYAVQQSDTELGTVSDVYDAYDSGIITYKDITGDEHSAVILNVGEPRWRTTDLTSTNALAFVAVQIGMVY